ncbi:hypothetical protein SEA_AIKOY__62 [Mycobacterium phage Aikoy]|uniref:Uncharacterized protein n=1 Tax=Mycobacterium phage Onyinye TaxID=2686235 RepID=A0A6B9L6W9_9CAUD|nr:hypothetical protein PP339_gp062 [Mycobacterium phage Onyinye]QHB37467.1 hypothetical protein SEA_ONYINYE_62 [Mycobacterium phage Onyinye]WKW85224.1 hypothetical protein SEA_AIKOY__62 [Mycobacterium phage Aikoy]
MIAVWGYAVLLKYWGGILFVIALWACLKYGVPHVRSWLDRRLYRRWIEADQARAYEAQLDRENREWLDAGIYEGRYPGYTMPMTYGTSIHESPEDWHMDAPTDPIAGLDDSDDYWRKIVRPK